MRKLLRPAVMLLCLALIAFSMPAAGGEAAEAPLLTLDQTEMTLEKGKTQKLKTTLENVGNPQRVKYAWESSDPDVATVDRQGNIKARDGGTARITCTATLEDGGMLTASAAVVVTVPVSGIKISTKDHTTVAYGESLKLDYTVKPENATNQVVEWSSSNEDIIRVDENGIVTAVAAGKASITAKSNNGKTARVQLYVPTLQPSGDAFTVDAPNSIYHFTYCGDDFENNVQITVKGNCFETRVIRNDPDIGIALTALRVGEGALMVQDRKDASAKFTIKIQVTENAFPAGRLLLIQDATFAPETGILTMKWTNTGSVTVTGAEIRINPLNPEGEPVVIGEGYVEEILLEERVLHTSAVVEPGKEATVSFGLGDTYPAVTGMEIAIDRIEKTVYSEDGAIMEQTVLELPDDRLCWYSAQQNAYAAGPENGESYAAPDNEVRAKAAKAHLGMTVIPVPGELAEAYGFACGGLMITEVEEGSPAERIGLTSGDLIFQVNDMEYSEEPYLMIRGCVELAEGRSVTILLQRDNEIWELTMDRDEE